VISYTRFRQKTNATGAFMKYRHITQAERYLIAKLYKDGLSYTEIGSAINRHKSSIKREIERNKGRRGYRPKQAQMYAEIRQNLKERAVKLKGELLRIIKRFLKKYWSPEQITLYLEREGLEPVAPLTIYRYIAWDKYTGGKLFKFLRRSNRKRKKRYGSTNSAGYIPNRVSIDDRPTIVDSKSRIGDWEIDTVIGPHHKGVLLTIVERYTQFTLIAKCASKKASDITEKVKELLLPFKDKVHTITADNGKEFSGHELFGEALNADVYFCHPYCSWERGLNENTNGLIRQFFPKKRALKNIKEKELVKVMNYLNYRPRKTLGGIMPAELFLNQHISLDVALAM
jgi:transposase, IS30 family